MTRLLIPLILCIAAMPAAEGKDPRTKLGAVLGRQVVDAGHVLEARAVAGQPGQVLIRWGDVDNAIPKGTKPGPFAWSGSASSASSASGERVRLVRVVRYEDGSKGKSDKGNHGAKRQDRLTSDHQAGNVSWESKTFGHWDGVIVQSASGSNIEIVCGPLTLSVKAP